MKLSEVKGERVFEVVSDIIDPICSIAMDENASELFGRKELPDGMTPWQFFLQRMKKSLPSLIKGHKDDFVRIMSSIEGITPEEYMNDLSLIKLLSDVLSLVTDDEFAAFF